MRKHTPGPWKVRNREHSERWTSDLIIVDPAAEGAERMLAFVSARNNCQRQRADARLIAASPDLLEVARTVAAWPHKDGETAIVDAARAALAKAEGP